MDLPLSTDFDPELLNWDEDDDAGNSDGGVDNFASEVGVDMKQESSNIANAPLSNFPSSANVGNIADGHGHESGDTTNANIDTKTNANGSSNAVVDNTSSYFTAFADQKLSSNNVAAAGLALIDSNHQRSSSGDHQSQMQSSHTTETHQGTVTGPQHALFDHSVSFEPLFPPNFFFPGLPSWDPSHAVANPLNPQHQANVPNQQAQGSCVSQEASAPNATSALNGKRSVTNAPVEQPKARPFPAQQQQLINPTHPPTTITTPHNNDFWGPAQIAQQIVMHQVKNKNVSGQTHHDEQSTAAAAAAAVAAAHNPLDIPLADKQHIQGYQTQQSITDDSTNTGQSRSSNSSDPSSSSDKKPSARPTPQNKKSQRTKNSNATKSNQGNKSRNEHNKKSSRTNNGDTTANGDSPPFYLFDAPCELRTNFLQAQTEKNVAPVNDSNAFHYGMAINGYHPEAAANTQVNPIMPASLGAAVLPNGKRVELIDGRHKHKKKASERNEREQQRAQKITELIEKLRNTMEKGGWKFEMKSKYQILSTSADYLKQLIKTTKEKEVTLQKAKNELAMRNQKLEEERALQEGRSDPESVTSSLTAFTSSEGGDQKNSSTDSSTTVAVASLSAGKRPFPSSPQDAHYDTMDPPKKILKLTDDDSNQTSSGSGSGAGSGQMDSSGSGNGGKNFFTSSSLSEMTDSNKGSSYGQGTSRSSNGQGNGGNLNGNREIKAEVDISLLAKEEIDNKTESSVSSTAAVVSGVGSKEHDHKYTSIVFTTDRKRKHRKEKTSLDEDFTLNHQEVFLASNVPQLIASPAGRIVACNDFFFKATGLTQTDVKRITIFSMVQVDQLSYLFDLVADSLRKSNSGTIVTKSTEPTSSSSSLTNATTNSENIECHQQNHFQTVTLPCVPFPQEILANGKNKKKTLYMNVTFMYDSNPSKRCIHCALTDIPGSNGKIGTVTSDLLSLLFPTGGMEKLSSETQHRITK